MRGGERPFGIFPKIHPFRYRHPSLIHLWNGGWLCLSISKPKTRMLCKVSMIILSCELCKNVDWGPMSQALLQSLSFFLTGHQGAQIVIQLSWWYWWLFCQRLSLKKFSHSDVDDPVLWQGIVSVSNLLFHFFLNKGVCCFNFSPWFFLSC